MLYAKYQKQNEKLYIPEANTTCGLYCNSIEAPNITLFTYHRARNHASETI